MDVSVLCRELEAYNKLVSDLEQVCGVTRDNIYSYIEKLKSVDEDVKKFNTRVEYLGKKLDIDKENITYEDVSLKVSLMVDKIKESDKFNGNVAQRCGLSGIESSISLDDILESLDCSLSDTKELDSFRVFKSKVCGSLGVEYNSSVDKVVDMIGGLKDKTEVTSERIDELIRFKKKLCEIIGIDNTSDDSLALGVLRKLQDNSNRYFNSNNGEAYNVQRDSSFYDEEPKFSSVSPEDYSIERYESCDEDEFSSISPEDYYLNRTGVCHGGLRDKKYKTKEDLKAKFDKSRESIERAITLALAKDDYERVAKENDKLVKLQFNYMKAIRSFNNK